VPLFNSGSKLKTVKSSIGSELTLRSWRKSNWTMPTPRPVKWEVLARWGNLSDTWVETGTYLGDTTNYLARQAKHVWTIEPSNELASKAKDRFSQLNNVTVVNGLSENFLSQVLDSINGPLSLWLDGHFSGGITHEGPQETPITQELEILSANLGRFPSMKILIDDFRCFGQLNARPSPYPPRTALVEFAAENKLDWTVEQDIFCAWSR